MGTLLKASEVAEILNIKTQTVYLMKAKNEIPFVQFGSTVRFDKDELEKWIESKKHS